MKYIVFAFIAACFLGISGLFVRNYLRRHRYTSLMCACLGLGWPVCIARDLKLLPIDYQVPLYALAATVGFFGFLLLWTTEVHR